MVLRSPPVKESSASKLTTMTMRIPLEDEQIKAMEDVIFNEFTAAVTSHDLLTITRCKHFIENLPSIDQHDLYAHISGHERYRDTVMLADDIMTEWIHSLTIGSLIDVFLDRESTWYQAKVLLNNSRVDNSLRVRYQGWGPKYDETICISKSRVAVQGAFIRRMRKKATKTKTRSDEDVQLSIDEPTAAGDDDHDMQADENIAVASSDQAAQSEHVRTSRSGRRIREAVAVQVDSDGRDMASSKGNSNRRRGSAAGGDDAAEQKDLNDWICGVCARFEASDGSDLLLCEGLCRRSFHFGCLGIDPNSSSLNSDQLWYCDDCCDHHHSCFICGLKGRDHQEVFKCNATTCGKFYHIECLKANPDSIIVPPKIHALTKEVKVVVPSLILREAQQDSRVDTDPTESNRIKASRSSCNEQLSSDAIPHSSSSVVASSQSSTSEKTTTTYLYRCTAQSPYEVQKQKMESMSFKCPLHYCFNCYEFHGSCDTADLTPCIHCPRAYHTKCIPPGSRFNSMCLLCPSHPGDALPSYKAGTRVELTSSSSSSSNHAVTSYDVFFDQIQVSDIHPVSIADNHFRLPLSLKDSVTHMAPTFKMLTRNDYDFMSDKTMPVGFIPEVCCECTDDCDEDCLNRVLRIECCSSKLRLSLDNGYGDVSICSVGSGCSNRQLQRRKLPKTTVFPEFLMGWGLKAAEDIECRSLVMEYVGEVIDHQEVQRRMQYQRTYTPQDKDFYIMELDNGLYVDGKYKGSNSRFINHSCDPNCELQRWVVKGQPRIGIFAIKDIKIDEPLSYDYQFDTKEEEAFKCYCGTEKCRGTMAPKKKKKELLLDANGMPQSREERLKLILLGKSKEKASTIESLQLDEWSRSYTGRYQPGDGINELKNGPVKSLVKAGRIANLFLLRNITAGSDFYTRSQKYRRGMVDPIIDRCDGRRRRRRKEVQKSSSTILTKRSRSKQLNEAKQIDHDN